MSETSVQITAMYKPHFPGMRPDGMGRLGSLMASTWRSYQSLTAWLVAHTNGPANATPTSANGQLLCKGTPDATTPQANAHIGGNHVTGLNSSATTPKDGRWLNAVDSAIEEAFENISVL